MEEAIREDIKARTPRGWYGLSIPRGWEDLVAECHQILVRIHPDYEVHQIKEKFGGLRYYCSIPADSLANGVIGAAEARSQKTCQNCGVVHKHVRMKKDVNGNYIRDEFDERMVSQGDPNVELRSRDGWLATLCDACTKKWMGYNPDGIGYGRD